MDCRLTRVNLLLFNELDRLYCMCTVLNNHKIWKYQPWCSVLIMRLSPLTEYWDELQNASFKAVNYKAFSTSNIFRHILFCTDTLFTDTHSQHRFSQADATKSCLHKSSPKRLTGSFAGFVVIMWYSVLLCNCNVFKQWSCCKQYNHDLATFVIVNFL